mgnify:CR=1 FL=1
MDYKREIDDIYTKVIDLVLDDGFLVVKNANKIRELLESEILRLVEISKRNTEARSCGQTK